MIISLVQQPISNPFENVICLLVEFLILFSDHGQQQEEK